MKCTSENTITIARLTGTTFFWQNKAALADLYDWIQITGGRRRWGDEKGATSGGRNI